MARQIDETKLERVYEAAMQLIVENGYGGASISAIAKMAKVSEGYLYRYYSGKKELVDYLLNTRIKEVGEIILGYMEKHDNSELIIGRLLNGICDMGEDNPFQIKFLYVLMNSYNFKINDEINEFMRDICLRVIDMGKKQGVVDTDISLDHFFTMMIIYPIQYINLMLKNFFNNGGFTQEDRESLISFCLNAVSPKS